MNFLGLDSPNKKIIFGIFLFCNIFLAITYSTRMTLGGELDEYKIGNSSILFLSTILVVLSFFLVSILYKLFTRFYIKKFDKGSIKYSSNVLDLIALFLLVASFLFSIFYGYGRIGFDSELSPSFVLYFNKFLVPILVVEVYLFYNFTSKSKLYYINVFLFLSLALFKGFTGPILHIGFLFVYRSYFFNRLNVKKLFFFFILGVLISPIIRIAKNIVIRNLVSGGELNFLDSLEFLYIISDVDNFYDLYFLYFERVLERFESVSITYYIIDNARSIGELFNNNDFLPFYLYHWIPQTIEKLILPNPIYDITQDYAQRAIAYQISPQFQWQTHIGYFGWFFIAPILSFFYFMYTFLLVFLGAQLTKLLSHKDSASEQLSWYFAISYVVHGWFNEYILYIQALVVFILIIFFSKFLVKPFSKGVS